MNSDNFDHMNPQISSIEVQEASTKPKKKVLQKNTVQKRQTKKQMGFVYNPYLRGLDEILDQKRDKTEERSRKINCYGHASIIKDPKYLDLQYHPKRKVNIQISELQGVTKIQKQTIQPCRQETEKKSCSDLRHSQQLLKSWDLQQQRQKKIDFICTIILIIVLLLLVSKSFRYNFFRSYSKLRRLL